MTGFTKYNAAYHTQCSGEILRSKLDEIKQGFCYKAQDLVNVLSKDNLWKTANNFQYDISNDEVSSPVMYNGHKYELFDIWECGQKNPRGFILVEPKFVKSF